MSQLTNYAENKLADMVRAQAWALPASLYIGLASVASDSAITEFSGTGYARVAMLRSLANWAGTQGVASTLASTGTSHASSNNTLIDWGTSGSAWGTASHVTLHDASTGGNVIAYLPLATPWVIASGAPTSLAIGALSFTLGLSGGCSDYLANLLIDFIWRGVAFPFPSTMYCALQTVAPTNAGGGTEVAGGGYARVPIVGSLTAWSGTQGAASTLASTGTSGQMSNNAAIAFAAPTAAWGTVTAVKYTDAATAGNLLFWAPLASSKTIPAGATPPAFAAGAQTIAWA